MAEFYTCTTDKLGRFDVRKLTDDSHYPESEYYVEQIRSGNYICNCPASVHHSVCRHLTIHDKFLRNGKINKGYFYDFKNDSFSQLFGMSDE